MPNDKTPMTPDDADALIGTVGRVRNPEKGFWKGDYKVVGYTPDPGDDAKVQWLKCETVARSTGVRILVDGKPHPTPQIVPSDQVGTREVLVKDRPDVYAPRVNPRWWVPGSEADAVKAKADADAKAKQTPAK